MWRDGDSGDSPAETADGLGCGLWIVVSTNESVRGAARDQDRQPIRGCYGGVGSGHRVSGLSGGRIADRLRAEAPERTRQEGGRALRPERA